MNIHIHVYVNACVSWERLNVNVLIVVYMRLYVYACVILKHVIYTLQNFGYLDLCGQK